MIVDDSFNYHARLKMELWFTIIRFHQLSCSLDVFKFDMIVHNSFFPFDRADDSEWYLEPSSTITNYHDRLTQALDIRLALETCF